MSRLPILLLGLSSIASLVALSPGVAAAAWSSEVVAGVAVEVYTPAGWSPRGDGRGLLVVLHGCVQGAGDLRTYANLAAGAEAFGVVIAAPAVPGGGVYAGCWDYYGENHTRDNRHNDDVLNLTAGLVGDPALEIDPDQVYIAGLSSGAGQALVLGCLAPEVYAGVGLAAAPGLGTEVFEAGNVATDAASAAALCASFAGDAAASFATQVAAVYTGTQDFTVAQGYATVNAKTFAIRYGGDLASEAFDVATLVGHQPSGVGTHWVDGAGPRIARIVSDGGTHAWPAGSGPGPVVAFVEPPGVNFGWFLVEFFTENNRRVPAAPEDTTGSDTDTDTGTDTDTDTGTGSDTETSTGGDAGTESTGESDTASASDASGSASGGTSESASESSGEESMGESGATGGGATAGGGSGASEGSATAGETAASNPPEGDPSGCACQLSGGGGGDRRRGLGFAALAVLAALRRRRA